MKISSDLFISSSEEEIRELCATAQPFLTQSLMTSKSSSVFRSPVLIRPTVGPALEKTQSYHYRCVPSYRIRLLAYFSIDGKYSAYGITGVQSLFELQSHTWVVSVGPDIKPIVSSLLLSLQFLYS